MKNGAKFCAALIKCGTLFKSFSLHSTEGLYLVGSQHILAVFSWEGPPRVFNSAVFRTPVDCGTNQRGALRTKTSLMCVLVMNRFTAARCVCCCCLETVTFVMSRRSGSWN